MDLRWWHFFSPLFSFGATWNRLDWLKGCTDLTFSLPIVRPIFLSPSALFSPNVRSVYRCLLCCFLSTHHCLLPEQISRLDCKDVLEITCTLETEGEENTAFILCTTFLTQQLQQQSLYCSWWVGPVWVDCMYHTLWLQTNENWKWKISGQISSLFVIVVVMQCE